MRRSQGSQIGREPWTTALACEKMNEAHTMQHPSLYIPNQLLTAEYNTVAIMNQQQDISTIATFGKWSSLCCGSFTFVSAISIFPLFFDFDSNGNVNYLCWLFVSLSYLLVTISNAYVVKTTTQQHGFITKEAFYSDVAAAFATIYACYECAIYYLQMTYLRRTVDPIGKSLFRDEPGTPVFALDLLGYFLLSISTIFVAFSLSKKKDEDHRHHGRFLRSLLLVHGLTGMTCVVVPAIPAMYEKDSADDTTWQFVLLFWCALFAPICFLMSKLKKKKA